MRKLSRLRMYAGFAFGLRRFLDRNMTTTEAHELIRTNLRTRRETFLRLIRLGIYDYDRSPFRPLLQLAGCEFSDVRAMVVREGIEATLERLCDAGVYFSFEEFKGRAPVVRSGRRIPLDPRQFDNPHLRPSYTAASGGSTGARTPVSHNLDHLAHQAAHALVTQAAHGLADASRALWRPVLAASSGISNVLRSSHAGRIPQRWFTPTTAAEMSPALGCGLATQGFVRLGRLCGFPLPRPEPVGLLDGVKVARWMAETTRAGGQCLLITSVSSAVRVCVAAREAGLDISGAVFMISGEPATPAKTQHIRATGARWFTTYGLTEAGRVAMGCASPAATDDMHVLTDLAAVIQRPRVLYAGGPMVNSLYLTSLLPSAPKILLNVEVDDYGVLERRACGCPLERLGYDLHLRDVRSFTKLTGEGVTLVGTELVGVLEDVLARRFGGSPLDYQIVEEEGEDGLTRLILRVSPRVGITEKSAVVRQLVEGLRGGTAAARVAQAIWKQAHTFEVRCEEPVWTDRGKLPHLRGSTRSPESASSLR